jgi:C4-dicarboxylate transporter DctM subunit
LILILSLLVLMFLGIPIVFCLGLSSAIYLLATDLKPLTIIAQRTMYGMDSFVLLAVPMFILSGYLMEQGGLSRRLVDWVEKIFGHFQGASGTITIVCCAIFAALTGSGPATVAAIGAVMMPALINSGYPKHISSGMLAAGGALGPIIPPSVAMIVYGSTMNVSIPKMFIGGIIPGIFIAVLFIVVNYVISFRLGIKGSNTRYTLKEVVLSTWRTSGILMLPVIVLGGIYSGIFTPTEAATVCVVYSIALGFIFKELSFKGLLDSFKRTIVTSATIATIIGISSVFGWILAAAKIPSTIAASLVPLLGNSTIYMLALMLVLFVVGCLMECLAAIVILAPILTPIGLKLGVDPLHLGVVFCINLVVGFITPPFGINLFTAVSTTGVPYTDVVRGAVPFIVVAVIAVFIFAFVPEFILFLPRMLG